MISGLLALIPNDTLEWILLLIGCAMGVFYGFDGWRGSVKDIDLKDSPRVKNFMWGVGVAFGIFIADFKSIVSSAAKSRLLLFYIAAFILSTFFVLVGSTVAIAFNFSRMRRNNPTTYPPAPFSPVWDYVRYGYGYHSKRYEAALQSLKNDELIKCRLELQTTIHRFDECREEQKRALSTHEQHKSELLRLQRYQSNFLPAYIKQVPSAIAAVDHYRTRPDKATRAFVAKQILQGMCAVVLEYHEQTSGLNINANYMVSYHKTAPPKDLSTRLKFSWEPLSRYDYFLSLDEYAFDIGRESFVLPVEGKGDPHYMDRVLPGAPLAFVTNAPVIIDDTRIIQYASEIDPSVREHIRTYFQGKWSDFRSFASLNIVGQGEQLGVVHIESNKEFVFGQSDAKKQEILSLLQPFCLLLGGIIKS